MDTAPLMAYTQSLHPRHTDKKSLNSQFITLKMMCHEYLKTFCYKYELYFELHQSGNLHVHGILIIKDNIKRLKLLKKMTDNIGNIVYKPIDDLIKWREYCTKTKNDMDKVLNIIQPITYNGNKNINWFEEYDSDASSDGEQIYSLAPPLNDAI